MKKRLSFIIFAVLMLIVSAVTLTACDKKTNSKTGDNNKTSTVVNKHAKDKDGSIEIVTDFFAKTFINPNLVITVYNNDELLVTENVKGTSSCYVDKDGQKVSCYKENNYYYYAVENENYHSYHSSNPENIGNYDKDTKDLYDANRFYSLTFLDMMNIFAEENGTFDCSSKVEEKDGSLIGSLSFTYQSAGVNTTLTAESKDGYVYAANLVSTYNTENETDNITVSIVYGTASITLPDIDAWDAEQIEEQRQKKLNDNRTALVERDAFFSSVLSAENVKVSVKNALTQSVIISETVADGIDFVNYGTYQTYAYNEGDDKYVVIDGDEKIYTVNYDDYNDYLLVWYSTYIGAMDYTVGMETVDVICNTENDSLTFTVKQDNITKLTISSNVANGMISQISIIEYSGDSPNLYMISIEYDAFELQKPDLTDFTHN